MVNTSYADKLTIRQLGLHEDVWNMFNRVGWREFMASYCGTYEAITYKFFSLFKVHMN